MCCVCSALLCSLGGGGVPQALGQPSSCRVPLPLVEGGGSEWKSKG